VLSVLQNFGTHVGQPRAALNALKQADTSWSSSSTMRRPIVETGTLGGGQLQETVHLDDFGKNQD
jgi:hypothetical protein